MKSFYVQKQPAAPTLSEPRPAQALCIRMRFITSSNKTEQK